MPPRWVAGLDPHYQQQLDAPNNESFQILKDDRQPPMLKFEGQLGVDERYPSSLYMDSFHLI